MTVIDLDEYELGTLYDYAIRDAMLTEAYALPFFVGAAEDVRTKDLREIVFSSIDRCRHSIDSMALIVEKLDRGAFHRAALADHSAREWVTLSDTAFMSARVRDLAIAFASVGICKYLDARYTTAIEISGMLESSTRMDGLSGIRDELRVIETALEDVLERLSSGA